ncbi:hypothetical protein C0J52_03444, partial [Blattella germanica]
VGAILDKTETSQKQEACLGVPGNVTENVVHCKTLWDGSMCWRNAEPGQIVSLPCPLTMESQDSFVIRECNSNGSWSKANYSQCLKTSEPNNESHYTALIDKWIPIIHIMSQIGYTVSLTTLVIAFVLLSCMKKLRCPRNTLLLHLFFSFMMRAAMKLIKDILFVKGVGLAKDVIVAENGFVDFLPDRNGFLVALLYCLLNTEVQAEVVRKWKYYNYNKEHCKRGSAHSLPAGLNSVLTTSRVYNCQHGSLSSSGVTPPFGDMELKGQDIQTVSKYLQDQRQEMTDYKPDKRPSLTQEIILNSLCNGDICYNPSCRHIAHAQNGFADHIGKPYHISYDGLDNSDLSPTMQTAFLPQGSSYQRRRSADSNTGHSQGFPKAQNGYASAHDDYCTSGKCLSSLGASRST